MSSSQKTSVRMTSRRYVALVATTAALILVASFSSGFAQNVLLVFIGAIAAVLVAKFPPLSVREAAPLLLTLTFLGLLGSTIFLALELSGRPATDSLPFPRNDGMLANFISGPGGPARNTFGGQFSIMSDSNWNLSSKIWFKRETEKSKPRNGFLRILFQLESNEDREPYGGIYSDLSYPPPSTFNVTDFNYLSFRVRLGQSSEEAPISVMLVLYSKNVQNKHYAFPSYKIEGDHLSGEWQPIRIPLSEFVEPYFVDFGADMTLDPTEVYRWGVILIGEPGRTTHGSIDLDDVRFEQR